MKILILFAAVGLAACRGNSRTQGKYVWDLLKAPLSIDEIRTLDSTRDITYPTYNTPFKTNFDCNSKAQPGFYADVESQCQMFHRCEYGSLNQTDYLCVNRTVFNQITLVCDMWYNVDCPSSLDYEDYANSRLYTPQFLFDTPPADYVAPYQLVLLQNLGVSQPVSRPPAPAPVRRTPAAAARPAARPAAPKLAPRAMDTPAPAPRAAPAPQSRPVMAPAPKASPAPAPAPPTPEQPDSGDDDSKKKDNDKDKKSDDDKDKKSDDDSKKDDNKKSDDK